MSSLLEKEEILKEAGDGHLERVLKYLHSIKGEQFITNEERDFIYWAALTNLFGNNLIKFEEYKEKKDDYGLVDTVNSLINTHKLMEEFVKQDKNNYFSVEDDFEEKKNEEETKELKQIIDEGDYSLMEHDVLNYQGVKEIVEIRRLELINILSEFNLLNKTITYEVTLFVKKQDLTKHSNN